MTRAFTHFFGALAAFLALAGAVAAGQNLPSASRAVAGVGEYVERYFAAARTVTTRDLVTLQPLGSNLRAQGRPRTLVEVASKARQLLHRQRPFR
jgi:hypothetical protein